MYMQGHEHAAAEHRCCLQQQVILFAHSLMAPEPSERLSAAEALAHPWLSPQSTTQAETDLKRRFATYSHPADILPVVPEGGWNSGDLQGAAVVQRDTVEQPVQPAASTGSLEGTSAGQCMADAAADGNADQEADDSAMLDSQADSAAMYACAVF